VPDPYYTGNFDYVYQLVTDGCRGLLAAVRQEEGI
jgi:protein-tyrosine phosphatase